MSSSCSKRKYKSETLSCQKERIVKVTITAPQVELTRTKELRTVVSNQIFDHGIY
jgi:hypothetical protein